MFIHGSQTLAEPIPGAQRKHGQIFEKQKKLQYTPSVFIQEGKMNLGNSLLAWCILGKAIALRKV